MDTEHDETKGLGTLLERLAKQPTEEDWAEMVRQQAQRINAVAFRLLGGAMTDDAVQETFLSIRSALPQYKACPDAQAQRWLLRIAANTAVSLLRNEASRRRREEKVRRSQSGTFHAEGDAPNAEMLAILRQSIAELPEQHRQPVVLRYFGEQEYPEVAEALGCSEGSARVRVQRALAYLREILLKRGLEMGAANCAIWVTNLSTLQVPPISDTVVEKVARRLPSIRTPKATPSHAPAKIGWAIAASVAAVTAGLVLWFLQPSPALPAPTSSAAIATSPPAEETAHTETSLQRFIREFKTDHPTWQLSPAGERLNDKKFWSIAGRWKALQDGREMQVTLQKKDNELQYHSLLFQEEIDPAKTALLLVCTFETVYRRDEIGFGLGIVAPKSGDGPRLSQMVLLGMKENLTAGGTDEVNFSSPNWDGFVTKPKGRLLTTMGLRIDHRGTRLFASNREQALPVDFTARHKTFNPAIQFAVRNVPQSETGILRDVMLFSAPRGAQ